MISSIIKINNIFGRMLRLLLQGLSQYFSISDQDGNYVRRQIIPYLPSGVGCGPGGAGGSVSYTNTSGVGHNQRQDSGLAGPGG